MNIRKQNELSTLDEFVTSTDPRQDHANVTNAASLMGDPDYSDFGPYGDVETAALNTYDTLMGEPDDDDDDDFAEQGGPKKMIMNAAKWAKNHKNALRTVGAAAGGYALGRVIPKRKSKPNYAQIVQARLVAAAKANTIANQVAARSVMGRISRNQKMPFFQLIGATLNTYPLAPTERFAAATLNYNLDRQATDTPFEAEIVPGILAGPLWTLTSVGTATSRYYVCTNIVIGINQFTGAPGTIFSITGTWPTINGTLVVSSQPFSFTIGKDFYVKFMIFPWILVTNKPLLALGSYSSTVPIVVNIAGLPSNSAVSMVIPGSLHTWTIAMRNRLA